MSIAKKIHLFMDVDGVLVEGYHANPAQRRSWDEDIYEDIGLARGELDDFFHSRFGSVLEGKTGLLESLQDYLLERGFQGSAQNVVKYWFEKDAKINPHLLRLVKKSADNGVHIYLATNQEILRASYLWNTLGLNKIFREIFYSAKIGVTKSNPSFFERVNETLGMDPRKDFILFFDDCPANVRVANDAGWNGYVYENFASFTGNPHIQKILSVSPHAKARPSTKGLEQNKL
ncbi:MAG: HAD-IA family hydrolase [Alphaproteobacteria bacterium]|nr:HAD-IA family hydrolase [Alphaproteobacteria bacterium]